MSAELACSFAEFKQRVKFALDQFQSSQPPSAEERAQLDKAIGLSYLNLSDWDAPTISTQAPIVLQLYFRATRKDAMQGRGAAIAKASGSQQ